MLSKEGKIGLVICTAAVIMLGLAPGQRKRAPILGTQYRLVLHACHGLRDGDPVKLAGVDAGRVVDIDFAPQADWTRLNPPDDQRPVVLVTVALDPGFQLGDGAGYKVISTLRGNHFINILPPPPGPPLEGGAILNQELTPDSEDQLQKTIRNFKHLAQRTKDMQAQFADPAFRRDMKDLASNMKFYTAEFERVSASSRRQVAQLSQTLSSQEAQLHQRIAEMDQQASRAAGYTRSLIPAMRAQLQTYRAQLVAGQKQLDEMVRSADGYAGNFKKYAADLENSPIMRIDGEKLTQQVHDWKNKLDDYANLAGDMHTLSSDPQVQKDLKAIPKRYKTQSEGFKERVHSIQEQVDRYKWLIPEEHREP